MRYTSPLASPAASARFVSANTPRAPSLSLPRNAVFHALALSAKRTYGADLRHCAIARRANRMPYAAADAG